jgi:hypothetical protein
MELKIRTYLPHVKKAGLIQAVTEISCTEQDGIIVYDNMNRELYFHVFLAEAYADYKFELDSDGKYLDIETQYDKLVEDKTLEKIIDGIGKDYFLLLESLDIEIENRLKQNTIESIVAKGIEKLITSLDKNLSPKNVKSLVKSLKDLNPEIVKSVSEIVKNTDI